MKTSGEIEAAVASMSIRDKIAPSTDEDAKIEPIVKKEVKAVPIGEKMKEIVPKVVINKPSAKKEKEAEKELQDKNEKMTISEASR